MRLGKSGKIRTGRGSRRSTSAPRRETVCFEALESRILLSAAGPSVVGVTADNRGYVTINLDARLDENTVHTDSVRIYTAGADGLLGTSDDVLQHANVTLNDDVIRIRSSIPADQRYRLVLDGSIIRDTNGRMLDGEFNGAGLPSGDGVAGGDYQIFTKRAQTQIVRFTTSLGIIDVRMFDDRPITVKNFLTYANAGDWDNTFFHRSAQLEDRTPFVIQGGGFNADQFLSSILSRGSIQNEPGRSNVRGTIAMAKLGGDPNSATNQWFFNVNDNSGNLDSQNGGFTVFGEIIDQAGLDVMDDIAALATIDASRQGSAFNEVPVLDTDEVVNGEVTPDDLVRISRIALLVDISGEPTQQLAEQNGYVVSNPNGEARVTIYSLSGANIGDLSDSLIVKFGRNDSIKSITIRNGFTAEDVGLRIEGASSVGKIVDQRSGAQNLAFIMSDTGIKSFTSNSGLSGFDLNDYYLEGGFQFSGDIDDDNDIHDSIALYVPEGSVTKIKLSQDLEGDVIIDGTVQKLDIRGALTNSTLMINGNDSLATKPMSIKLGRVDNSSLESEVAISSLSFIEWLNGDGGDNRISAPSIGSLTVTGSRTDGLAGDLMVGIVTSELMSNGTSLGNVKVAGSLLGGTWDVAGDVASFSITGDAINTTINVSGNVRAFNARSVVSTALNVDGAITAVTVAEWNGGGITTTQLDRLDVRGDSRAGFAGNYYADLTINGQANTTVLNQARIAGDLGNGVWTITGNVDNVSAGGNTDDWDFDVTGSLNVMTLNAVTDTSVAVSVTATRLQFDSWNGGEITGRTFLNIIATGDRSRGDNGDFFADINLTTGIQNLTIAGDLVGDLTMRLGERFSIGGDVIDSSFNFSITEGGGATQALISLDVGGQMLNSTLRAQYHVNEISVGAMIDSGIYVGAPESQNGLPDDGSEMNLAATITSIEIRGINDQPASFVNSFVVAGQIGTVRVHMPQTDNFGRPFGIAANTIQRVETFFGRNDRVALSAPASTPSARGDYQVRVNFAPPA